MVIPQTLRRARPGTCLLPTLTAGLLLLPLLPERAVARQVDPATIPDSRERTIQASRATGPITIDGRLDEPDWERAEIAVGFLQMEPHEGEPAAEPTEVRILFDDQNIYVVARMYDSDPSSIQRQLTRRGEGGRAYDYFQVSLDSNRDGRTGYTFRITAAGVQVDRYNYDDVRTDDSWEGIWESAVRVDEEGWIAELRIPLSQLRYDATEGPQVWGAQFGRRKISTNERTDWAWVPQGVSGNVSRWGQLTGLDLPPPRRHVELLPYVMSGLEQAPASPNDPFFSGRATQGRVGADIRYALGGNFRLDAAINPDFGQVEVDPRVVNLTQFETFFPERRPFFTRDDRIFDFGLVGHQETLFYSRRIGRSPQGRTPSGADYVDRPSETSILGTAKVTGRTQGGLTVGILGAATAEEWGRAAFLGGGEEETSVERFLAEPRMNTGTFRLLQELRGGETVMGAMATHLARDLPEDGSFDFLPERAHSLGLDFEHNWADRTWGLSGYLVGSRVTGTPEAITRIQRSPNHYHQRPDQDYLELDMEATSLTGMEWRIDLNRQSGRNWTGGVSMGHRTPGFEVNDLGFSSGSEGVGGGARISYRQPDPGEILRSWNVTLMTFQNWRTSVLDDLFSGAAWSQAHRGATVVSRAGVTFLDWSGMNLSTRWSPSYLSDRQTRGGPLMVSPSEWSISLSGNTDRRQTTSYSANISLSGSEMGDWGRTISAGLETRPANGILLSLGPTYQRSLDRAQFVTRFPDASFDATYGTRYLFGELERHQFSMDTRVNFIFSPTLSFQLFAQPLISRGGYRAFRQLAEAGTYRFLRAEEGTTLVLPPALPGGHEELYCEGGSFCRHEGRVYLDFVGDGTPDASFSEPNFHIRSLRGSAVLRWEYRPGSRIYFVWQQRRQARDLYRDFDLGRDLGGLFSPPGEHAFIVKVNYWIDF